MPVSIFFGHVVSLGLSFSSVEHHRSHSCLGTGMRVGKLKHICQYRASLPIGIRDSEQYHGTSTSGTDCLNLRNSDTFWFVCVGELATVSRYCYCCARV